MKKEVFEALKTIKTYCENQKCIDCPLISGWCVACIVTGKQIGRAHV